MCIRDSIVAGAYQLLQSQLVEAEREVFEEIALIGVVAVTKYRLALEVVPVVAKLPFYIRELGIELVFLGFLCSV